MLIQERNKAETVSEQREPRSSLASLSLSGESSGEKNLVQGLGLGRQGFGFRVWGLRFRV